jgi:LPXTG-motif cell wall-anchored protein
MHFSELLKFCQCNGTQICPFCQGLTVIGIVLLSCLLGYVLGKRKKDRSVSK